MAMVETVKQMRAGVMKPKETAKEQNIEFKYYAPAAKKVSLAGDFNSWNVNSTPMKKGKDGTWVIAVKLRPGRHEYKYYVDGAWAQDVPCSDRVPNSFGTYNCVMGVH